MKNPFRLLALPLACISLCAAAQGFPFFMLGSQPATGGAENIITGVDRLSRTLMLINGSYIDTINTKKMVDDAITSFVTNLDPHSAYIPAEQVKEANEALDGSFEGVGIEFAIIADTITVQNVISGGPAEAVGLNVGDKIVKIDTARVAGVSVTTDDVRAKLRGPKGSRVEVGIRRSGVPEILDFTIVRDKIPLTSVDAAYLTDDNIFYFKLGRFAAQSMDEFKQAFAETCVKGDPAGIILDLRGNGGGFLNVALELANTFLEKGQTILYTEGLHLRQQSEIADGNGFYRKKPLVILVDENSASASEIVSGAVQDWDRGIIIGRRTFGKGLVQRQFQLNDGSQLRLTIARYHTPSGRVIQTPYKNGERDEYYHKIVDRWNNGEFFSVDSLHFPDSLKFETKMQHRTVYGGGGIMPDIFIPSDTTALSSYYTALIRKGIINEFINGYCDKHRKELKSSCKDFKSFCSHYDRKIAPKIINELAEYGAEHGVERNDEQLQRSMPLLGPRVKGLVARSLFGTTEYFRVINMECDPEFDKALEIISRWPSAFPSLFD